MSVHRTLKKQLDLEKEVDLVRLVFLLLQRSSEAKF